MNFVSVVVVVSQRRVYLGKGDRRISHDNFSWGHTLLLMPNNDVPDLDAMTEDVWLAAAIPCADADIFRHNRQRIGQFV